MSPATPQRPPEPLSRAPRFGARVWVALVIVLLAAGVGVRWLARRGTAQRAGARSDLVILSPHWEGIRYEFGHAFERWYQEQTGRPVTVDWRDFGGTSDDVKYIRSGFAKAPDSGGIGIDLFFGGGIPAHEQLAEEGVFAPYRLPDELLNRIPPQYPGGSTYDPEFRYYGTVLSGFGIVYNKVVLGKLGLPEPTTWEDMAAPELVSWVGMGDPRSSGSSLMVFQIILQA